MSAPTPKTAPTRSSVESAVWEKQVKNALTGGLERVIANKLRDSFVRKIAIDPNAKTSQVSFEMVIDGETHQRSGLATRETSFPTHESIFSAHQ
jgi:hypothetical protein